MFCSECGSSRNENSNFCESCGADCRKSDEMQQIRANPLRLNNMLKGKLVVRMSHFRALRKEKRMIVSQLLLRKERRRSL